MQFTKDTKNNMALNIQEVVKTYACRTKLLNYDHSSRKRFFRFFENLKKT